MEHNYGGFHLHGATLKNIAVVFFFRESPNLKWLVSHGKNPMVTCWAHHPIVPTCKSRPLRAREVHQVQPPRQTLPALGTSGVALHDLGTWKPQVTGGTGEKMGQGKNMG